MNTTNSVGTPSLHSMIYVHRTNLLTTLSQKTYTEWQKLAITERLAFLFRSHANSSQEARHRHPYEAEWVEP